MLTTYLGHASFMIEHGGVQCLVDPWFSHHGAFLCSWHQFPENSDLDLEAVRNVDFIAISHEHQDHFDLEFLKTVSQSTTVLIPEYKHKYLLNMIKNNTPLRVIEVKYKNKFELAPDFSILALNQIVPIQMDNSWIFESPECTVAHVNDMALTKDDIDWLRENYKINYLLHQYSGANWYPHIYEYDENIKKELSSKKVLNKFHHCVTNFLNLNAEYLIPCAGPPCFLDDDDDLFELNFKESSTFPSVDTFYQYVEGLGLADRVILCLPNDIVSPSKDVNLVLDHPAYKDKRAYLEQYKDKRKSIIQNYKKSISNYAEPDQRLMSKFKNCLEPLIESSAFFRREIGGKVLFNIGEQHKYLVNFRKRKNQVTEWDGHEQFSYSYRISNQYMNMILDGQLLWEELFLSCRFTASRYPDVHNQALQTFLYYSDDNMYKVYEEFFTRQKKQEKFEIIHEGQKYLIGRYCPHALADLSTGKIVGGEIVCPAHGWSFSLKDGKCLKQNTQIFCKKIK